MPQTPSTRSSVVVTGDVTIDWNIAHLKRSPGGCTAWNSTDCTRVCPRRGGAALLADLIGEMAGRMPAAGEPPVEVSKPAGASGTVTPQDPAFHHSYALWTPQRRDAKAKPDDTAWRVSEFMGLDPSAGGWTKPLEEQLAHAPAADVIVVDDADLGFRERPELWAGLLADRSRDPWIVHKMSCPVASGKLWTHLHREHPARLVVLMRAEDLRRTEVQVSRALSWERTAQDVAWELLHNPRVRELADCAHVVVSFETSGALLLSSGKATLFFDTSGTEGAWAREYPGGMVGYTSCLAAAIVRQLVLAKDTPDLAAGVQSGVAAMRALLHEGYADGRSSPPDLCFPLEKVAGEILKGGAPCASIEVQDPAQFLRQPGEQAAPAAHSGAWCILRQRHPEALDELARRIVLHGPKSALADVPMGRFGKLLTVDRREIESYRTIGALVREYCSQNRPKRPLSIAVFGAPGSGKSFGVTQMATSLYPELIHKVEFNLSQLAGPPAMHDALHQVRDVGLSGKIPLVFWDEFDTSLGDVPMGWLRHFLAPMQDGCFLQGETTHPIGQAIFVFAGGTAETLEGFGGGRDERQLRELKVPDFLSRLKGFINVMGPNPVGGNAAADPHFVVRRALLLHSFLSMMAPQLQCVEDGRQTLAVDPGVLSALLGVSRYRHGARSMESILAMSQLSGRMRFERSCLPPEAQLDLHVDGLELLALVQQIQLTPEMLERLAVAAHEVFCEGRGREGYRYGKEKSEEKKTHPQLVPYEKLDEWARKSNRDTVRSIPRKLATAGYTMIPSRGNQLSLEFPGEDLDKLARLEHQLWMEEKLADGYTLGDSEMDGARFNEFLLPWDELPEGVRHIDRDLVRGIPAILARAGYAVVKLQG
jgi:hypothetical protein